MAMVAPNTVRLWAIKGLLRPQTTAGGHRRYSREEVERFLGQRTAIRSGGQTESLRILIVDDDAAFARYLTELAASTDHGPAEVAVAADGFEAGLLMHDFRPQVVLLDLMMPGLDGFEVCRRIKAEPYGGAIRVIALTGYQTPENIGRILAAGAEVCLPKPIDEDRLLELLNMPSGRQDKLLAQ